VFDGNVKVRTEWLRVKDVAGIGRCALRRYGVRTRGCLAWLSQWDSDFLQAQMQGGNCCELQHYNVSGLPSVAYVCMYNRVHV
jgi:hypothetical protein